MVLHKCSAFLLEKKNVQVELEAASLPPPRTSGSDNFAQIALALAHPNKGFHKIESFKRICTFQNCHQKALNRKEDITGYLNGSKELSSNFTEKYKLRRLLGEGAFGFVMTATHLTDGRKVAVKFIDTSKILPETWLPDCMNVLPKIAILKRRDHPNIIQDTHHHLPEPVARKIFAQIALAIQHFQAKGFIHWDIKNENIVVDSSYNVILIDFGSAAKIPKAQHDYFTQFRGTNDLTEFACLIWWRQSGPPAFQELTEEEIRQEVEAITSRMFLYYRGGRCKKVSRCTDEELAARKAEREAEDQEVESDLSSVDSTPVQKLCRKNPTMVLRSKYGCCNLILGMLQFDPKSHSTLTRC
ncbi:kinase-like domain-containing protein [Chytriomyces cf. hyalinus JEL632]|nr:kinase-like domain-containing protein [Chytriomyces cf. hyalinus JEL632]